MDRRRVLLCGVLLLLAGAGRIGHAGGESATMAGWHQFRGPGGQGHAEGSRPPVEWSEQHNISWKTEISGLGHSSPVIAGEQVWLTTATTDGSRLGALGLNVVTGELLQSVTLFCPEQVQEIHHDNSYASPTPVIAGQRLFCHYGRYGTACLNTTDGEVLWRNNDLVIDHQGGPGSSPVLFEDLLIITCDGADAQYVAALHVETGQMVWRRDRSAPFRENPVTRRAFATPVLIEHDGKPQLLSPGADQLHAYDPATGEELWHVRYVGFSTVPCPVYGNGVAYFCTGFFEPQLWAVQVDGSGDVTDSHVQWRFRGAVPETPSPLLVDDRIYLVSNTGVGTVVHAGSGERMSQFRLGGNYSASPLYAGGHMYFCSEDGLTKVVEPGRRPRVIESNRLAGRIKASPAVCGDALILRTDGALYRIEEPGK